ncbi:MAG: FecR family protein [Bdellovibrionota bacterium]
MSLFRLLDKIDRLVVGVATLAFLASIILLLDERFLFRVGSESGEKLESIANVSRSAKDVRRRLESDVIWLPLRTLDDVFESDSVFTGEGSEAEIKLKDGSQVFVEQSSLVVIRTQKGETRLDIQKGAVSGRLGSRRKLVISTGEGKVSELSGADAQVKIAVKEGGGTQLTVLSGEAELKSDTGAKSVITKNQLAEITVAGEVGEVKSFKIELLSPAPDLVIRHKSGDPLKFEWKGDPKIERYQIELARDENFKEIILKEKAKTSSISVSKLPDKGPVYWRIVALVEAVSGRRDESLIYKFSLLPDSPPKLSFPVDDSAVTLVRTEDLEKALRSPASSRGPPPIKPPPGLEQTGYSAALQWQDDSGSAHFEVQLAAEKDFKEIIFSTEVDGLSARAPPLLNGTFYWRVRAKEATRPDAPWSKPYKFIVKLSDKGLDGPPVLASPSDLEQLVFHVKFTVRFEWKERAGAKNYSIDIANTADFSEGSILLSTKETRTNYVWAVPGPGTYYWRVRAITDTGAVTVFSETRKLDIVTAAPEITRQEMDFEIPLAAKGRGENSPRLVWNVSKILSGTPAFRVELADNREMKNLLVREDVRGTTYAWDRRQPGTFYWRVTPVDGSGNLGSASGLGVMRVTVAQPVVTGQAKFIEHTRNVLVFDGPPPEAEVSWSAVPFADGYELQLADNPNFNGAQVFNTAARSQTLKLPKAGKYYCRVRALAASNEPLTNFSAAHAFEVGRILDLNHPVADSPRAKETLIYYGDIPAQPYLKWNKIDEAMQYRVEISRDQNFSSPVEVNTLKENEYQLLKPLPDGLLYYWRVRSERGDVVSEWGGDYQFYIKREPMLPQVKGLSSSRKVVYTGDSEVKFDFKWEPTVGAKAYAVEIFGSLEGGKAQEAPYRVLFTDKTAESTILGTGNDFYWRVSAVSGIPSRALAAAEEGREAAKNLSKASVPSDLLKVSLKEAEIFALSLGIGYATATTTQALPVSGVNVHSGQAVGVKIGALSVAAEWWPLGARSWWGVGADVSTASYAMKFTPDGSGTTGEFESSELRGGVSFKARHKLRSNLSLIGSLGVKQLPTYFVEKRDGQLIATVFEDMHATQALQIRFDPDYGRYSFRLSIEVAEGFADVMSFGVASMTPTAEAWYRFDSFLMFGMKFVSSSQTMFFEVQGKGTNDVYEGSSSMSQSTVYFIIGLGM